MENSVLQEDRNSDRTDDNKSTENFQKYIYDLFDKNGVLNDLRAYLRGHIIDVLKSVHTGDTLMCQKHFTQRLELSFQALNILIAEYLLRLHFSYSLSVFISEIPLANMVFEFAKSLLGNSADEEYQDLRFKDNDVWCVLNYLGIKCDAGSASNIMEMYRKEEKCPLLICILKCLPLYQKQGEHFEDGNMLEVSMSSSSGSSTNSKIKAHKKSESFTTCMHHAFCESCKQRISKIQRKYKRKKEDAKRAILNPINIESILKNVDVIEKSIIEEMFDQLKSVYEGEVDVIRGEEERKIKRSLANHALLFQKRYDEMEESFKAREAELETNVQQKKKFLWGLASALREQHSNMSAAMKAVQQESERLTSKEDSLRKQIKEAENIIKKRGEEMRCQISNELIVLESQLKSMKSEREIVERERLELEKLRELCVSNTKISLDNIKEKEELQSCYDLLRDEMLVIKNHYSSTKIDTKCMIDKGIMTDKNEFNVTMNNEQELDKNVRSEDAVRTPNQVVNDLKKQKNVNFNQANLEEIGLERNRQHSRSSDLSDKDERTRGHLELLLREENERLKAFSDQQREHIDELSREQIRLRSELIASRLASPRPRTAPAVMPTQGVNPSARRDTTGWLKGAGEELSLFHQTHSRILVPGDVLPFVGVISDRHNTDSRRHLINQWRSLRRRYSPVRSKQRAEVVPRPGTSRQDHVEEITGSCSACSVTPQLETAANGQFQSSCNKDDGEQQRPEPNTEVNKKREKSPKTVLQEAKQKLKNKDKIKQQPTITSREKSPKAMLREAKLRLRKLEIEAEAVEKSYLDFRRRKPVLRNEDLVMDKDSIPSLEDMGNNFYVQHSSSFHHHREDEPSAKNMDANMTKELFHKDFEKYLREYQTKEIVRPHFSNKNTTTAKIKPIPDAYTKITQDSEDPRANVNYLETPLTEFRKLYHSQKPRHIRTENKETKSPALNSYEFKQHKIEDDKVQTTSSTHIEKLISDTESNKIEFKESPKNRIKGLKILKDHISEIYGSITDEIPSREQNYDMLDTECIIVNSKENNKNLLKVEIENVTESNSVKIKESQDDLMIVVETSIDARELRISQHDNSPMRIVISPKDNTCTTLHDNNQHVGDLSDRSSPEPCSENSAKVVLETSRSGRTSSLHERFGNPNENVSKSSNGKNSPISEKTAHFTKNDVLDAIFDTKVIKDVSSIDIGLDNSKDGVNSPVDAQEDAKNYSDEFSADVDNYNSVSELGISLVSHAKTSDDDNFWD